MESGSKATSSTRGVLNGSADEPGVLARVDDAASRNELDTKELDTKERGAAAIYKSGRGYWVRMLTAVALGVLFLSGAGWAWQQLEALPLPTPTWNMGVSGRTGELSPGDSVQLLNIIDDQPALIGTATVKQFKPEGRDGSILLEKLAMVDANTAQDARRIAKVDGAGAQLFVGEVRRAFGVPIVERVYIKAIVSGLLLLIGTILIWKYVARKPTTVDFLIATDEEMKRVNWSTRKIIIDSTYVVVGATILIALYVFIFDLFLNRTLYAWIIGG
jgi:preprotein translocase SecE subunit